MKKFARKSIDTNKGINSGWVIQDSHDCIELEESALQKANEMGYNTLEEAFKNSAIYWTEWDVENEIKDNEYYFTESGEKIEMQEFKIEITEKLQRVINIKAFNVDEAKSEVERQHKTTEIVLNWNDFTEVEFEVLE